MYYIYDIESYPNVFTIGILHAESKKYKSFEISERRNDYKKLINTLYHLQNEKAVMVGFNNVGYDYPVLHYMINQCSDNADYLTITKAAHKKTEDIIKYTSFNDRFKNIIWRNDEIVKQLDLFKIHHFDNSARGTSLKMLEFNMRSKSIQDLPYEPGKPLTASQIDPLMDYMKHDIEQTLKFFEISLDKIKLREDLSKEHGKDFTNHNDGNIGKEFIVSELENKLGSDICYYRDAITNKKKPRQTIRESIAFKKIIFPYVKFKRPEFNLILDWLNNQVITETKKVLTELEEKSLGDLVAHSDLKKTKGKVKTLNTIVDDFKFVFGTGGIHGSVDPCTVSSDDEYIIVDLDVTSYYPSLAIENDIFPAHLGIEFCDVKKEIKKRRKKFKKGSPNNAALKLALNKPYGDSNNKYSPFCDPQYTMTITINGQLLLCMLSESLMEISSLRMIQANTDGITVILKRTDLDVLKEKCDEWELETGLELEYAYYSKMFIRDVNNYLAVYENGGVKRKGAYAYFLEDELDWHQNHSSLVIPKAAEAFLVHGEKIEDYIEWHDDPFDFYLRAKVNKNCKLLARTEGYDDIELQKISRYYISNKGPSLVKLMPPMETGVILKDKENSKNILKLNTLKDKSAQLKKKLKLTKKELKLSLDDPEKLLSTSLNETIKGLEKKEGRAKELIKLWRRRINREININKGFSVAVVNVAPNEFPTDINYDFYIEEVKKLVNPLLKPFKL